MIFTCTRTKGVTETATLNDKLFNAEKLLKNPNSK